MFIPSEATMLTIVIVSLTTTSSLVAICRPYRS